VADDAWLGQAPPEEILAGAAVLRRTCPGDTAALVEAVNASLEHLRPWMPWAQLSASAESIGAFLAGADASWQAGTEFQYLIAEPDSRAVLGCCGLHARLEGGALEIGYWVHVEQVRRGLASAAAGALTQAALGLPGVSRVEIHCSAANIASAGVPRRLGFRLDRMEHHPPSTPGETDEFMIWVRERRV
jgi:RimJ/RimL family protein N-acetyltransferase